MRDFAKYIENAKELLDCNATEEYKKDNITYLYTSEQIEANLDYFKKSMEAGLSAYKALLFFDDYLNGDYEF